MLAAVARAEQAASALARTVRDALPMPGGSQTSIASGSVGSPGAWLVEAPGCCVSGNDWRLDALVWKFARFF